MNIVYWQIHREYHRKITQPQLERIFHLSEWIFFSSYSNNSKIANCLPLYNIYLIVCTICLSFLLPNVSSCICFCLFLCLSLSLCPWAWKKKTFTPSLSLLTSAALVHCSRTLGPLISTPDVCHFCLKATPSGSHRDSEKLSTPWLLGVHVTSQVHLLCFRVFILFSCFYFVLYVSVY